MSATNTVKQGHAFLIKCLREWSEPMVAGGRGGEGRLLDQPIKGTSVITRRKKKGGRKKESGKGGAKKKCERKGHEWQLI